MCAKFYENHWKHFPIIPIVVCGTSTGKDRLKQQFENVFTLQEYIEGFNFRDHLFIKFFYHSCYFSTVDVCYFH